MTVEIFGENVKSNPAPEAERTPANAPAEKPAVFVPEKYEPRHAPAKRARGEGFVLAVQLLLCALIAGAVFAAQSLGGEAARVAGEITASLR